MSGSIPPELGSLSNLSSLDFGGNQLSESIPSELGNLSNLISLIIGGNRLSGSIPPELGNLSSLTLLEIRSNLLAGDIPPELGNLLSLRTLNLQDNQLNGSIPPELGDISNLRHLRLSSNQLSGSIPPELGDLSVRTLMLQSNQLSGSIPPELASLTALFNFDIGYNALWTDDPTLRSFLDAADPDWDETQTIAPAGLAVASVADRTVWLEWTPIPYSDDFGGYQALSQVVGGPVVLGGHTSNKLASVFPVTDLQPNQAYDLFVATFTRPHSSNRNTVVSDQGGAVMATTTSAGCDTPVVTVSGDSIPYTLTVTSTHDTYQWVTGETAPTVQVRPTWASWYWVTTTGPGACEEAAVVLAPVLFYDGFESGDFRVWD